MANLTGHKFGRLYVMEQHDNGECICECSCTKRIKVNSSNLVSGSVTSCGHIQDKPKVTPQYAVMD